MCVGGFFPTVPSMASFISSGYMFLCTPLKNLRPLMYTEREREWKARKHEHDRPHPHLDVFTALRSASTTILHLLLAHLSGWHKGLKKF